MKLAFEVALLCLSTWAVTATVEPMALPADPEDSGSADTSASGSDEGPPRAAGEDDKTLIADLWRQLKAEQSAREAAQAEAESLLKQTEDLKAQNQQLSDQLTAAGPELDQAKSDLAEALDRDKEKEEALKSSNAGPVTVFLLATPYQALIALIAGFVGVLALLGSPSFSWGFHSVCGAVLSGLLAASGVSYAVAAGKAEPDEGVSWLKTSGNLVSGQGDLAGNATWLIVVILYIIRWRSKIIFALWARVDTLHLLQSAPQAAAREPLLAH